MSAVRASRRSRRSGAVRTSLRSRHGFRRVPGPSWAAIGDQGRLAQGDLPPAFSNKIFELEPGEVSDIVVAEYGFLIFQVVECFPAEMATQEDVAGEIREALRRRHVDELATGFLGEARERYNVKLFPENFPFEYRGDYAN